MTHLKISGLSRKFSNKDIALSDVSFEVSKGKIIGIVGESGSGKSTLLKIVAGLETQDKGTVHLGDLKILNSGEKLVPGYNQIQLVHQGFLLYPYSTVEENVKRPLLGFDKEYRNRRLKDTIKMLGLFPHKDKLPKELSGGQQQKVAIGRALSSEPEILLLDEPFSNLDSIQKRELVGELKTIFEKLKITVVIVTHDLDDALQMADELVIIKKGKIVQRDSVQNIFRKPFSKYVANLFSHLNPIPGEINSYIRPSDIKLFKGKGIEAIVLKNQFLIHHNLLTVQLKISKQKWILEDQNRKFNIGDLIYLRYDLKYVLKLQI